MKKIGERSILAQNIISLRKAKEWSQMDLARRANVGLNTLKQIETDKSEGWPITRERLAKALGCSVDDLHQRPPVSPPSNPDHVTLVNLANENRLLALIEKGVPMALKQELEAIKVENDALKAKINLLPPEFWKKWPPKDEQQKAFALFFATLNREYLDRQKGPLVKQILHALKAHGLFSSRKMTIGT